MPNEYHETRTGWPKRTWGLIGGSIALFALVVLVFWLFGLFDKPESESDAKVLVALLALVGLLMSETVAVIGLLIKDSVDQRTSDLRALEIDRNRTDIAIRAVQLLDVETTDTSRQRNSGAIAALVSLGQLELALTLVSELWPEGLIPDQAAANVISKALRDTPTTDDDCQETAVFLLAENSERLLAGDSKSYTWPFPVADFPHHLNAHSRRSLIYTAHQWMRDKIRFQEAALVNASTIVLLSALDDENTLNRSWAASALRTVQPYLSSAMAHGDHVFDKSDVDDGLAKCAELPSSSTPLCEKINKEVLAILEQSDATEETPA